MSTFAFLHSENRIIKRKVNLVQLNITFRLVKNIQRDICQFILLFPVTSFDLCYYYHPFLSHVNELFYIIIGLCDVSDETKILTYSKLRTKIRYETKVNQKG